MKKNNIVFVKVCIICFVICFAIMFVSQFLYESEGKEYHISNYDIDKVVSRVVDKSETDSDVVEKYFAKGMNVKEYIDVFKRKENYVISDGKYKTINYNFDKRLHYRDIEEYLYNMNNSDIVNLEIIGKSADNRNIYGIEIGNGKDVVFIDANIHAAEVGNTPILMRFLSELVNKYESNDKDVVKALNNVKLAVIPCINPDGYELYNFGIESIKDKTLWVYVNRDNLDFTNIKSNANGVDLNRNFPTQNSGLYYSGKVLSKNVSTEKTYASSIYFNGYSMGSEPETKAAMYFMLKHFENTKYYVNMHSQGRVIYAGKPNLSNDFNNLCSSFGKKASNITGYRLHAVNDEKVGEGNDGSATDFMAELANGFRFSSKTGRLSSDKYINNSATLDFKYPVITLETTRVWNTDPKYYKDEYYNYGIRNLLFKLIKKEL